jgi:aryl-alcohol dehydrogenase-like predicted oxidoreductase
MKQEHTSGLQSQTITIGCWQLSSGHSERFNPNAIFAQLEQYCRAGFSTFDCGDIYTGVEEILGEFRAKSGYDFTVNTKLVPDLDALPSLTSTYIDRIIDRSLSRLGVEQLHLVQLHWWDFRIPGYVEAAQHLAKLRQAGKIAHIGTTNFDTVHLATLIDAGVPVVSNQVQYSLIDLRPAKTLLDYVDKAGLQLFCYGTLAGGLLSNHWLGVREENYKEQNRSHTKYHLIIKEIGGWEMFQRLLQCLSMIAAKHKTTIAVVTTAYTVGQKNCSAIVGFSYEDRTEELRQALSLRLDTQDLALLEGVVQNFLPLTGDVYELERDRTTQHARIMKYNLNNL